MKCKATDCLNSAVQEDVLCFSCMARQIVDLSRESVERVSRGETVEQTKSWFYAIALKWAEDPYYRFCATEPEYCAAVDQGLEVILEKLGLGKNKDSEWSYERWRAASELGLFGIPPVEAPPHWVSERAKNSLGQT